jgi:hypothetical protein
MWEFFLVVSVLGNVGLLVLFFTNMRVIKGLVANQTTILEDIRQSGKGYPEPKVKE